MSFSLGHFLARHFAALRSVANAVYPKHLAARHFDAQHFKALGLDAGSDSTSTVYPKHLAAQHFDARHLTSLGLDAGRAAVGVVTVVLDATEQQDTASFGVDSGQPVRISGGGGARVIERKIHFDRARIYAVEALDVALLRATPSVRARIAATELPDLAYLGRVRFRDVTRLAAYEEMDHASVRGESSDDPTIDNENFLMLAA